MTRLPAAVLALLVLPGTLALGDTRRTWDFTAFSSLSRTRAEAGAAPNDHPLQVDPAALAQVLGSVRCVADQREAPLFAPAELPALCTALAEALALAQPGEDLVFMSSFKRDSGWFAKTTGVTARVFAQGGRLNLIVHDTQLDYLAAYGLEGRMTSYTFGSSTALSPCALSAP